MAHKRTHSDDYENQGLQCDGDFFQKIKEWDGRIMTGVKTAIFLGTLYLGMFGLPGLAKKDDHTDYNISKYKLLYC
jgi:hypothetical protein